MNLFEQLMELRESGYDYNQISEYIEEVHDIRMIPDKVMELCLTFTDDVWEPQLNLNSRWQQQVHQLPFDEFKKNYYNVKKGCSYQFNMEAVRNEYGWTYAEGVTYRRLYYLRHSIDYFTKDVVERIFEADNYTCQLCFTKRKVKLHTHHIIPGHKHKNKFNNGITLCSKCHKLVHQKRFKPQKPFSRSTWDRYVSSNKLKKLI